DLAGEAEYVASGFDPWISKAPAHIVISVSEEVYHRRYQQPDKLGEDGEIAWTVPHWWIDAGAAMMTVLLSAADRRLVAGFLGRPAMPGRAARLGLPEDQKAIGVIAVGHPAPGRRSGSLDRMPARANVVIHRDRWQG